MTRINLIPVEELSDQHLLAEYRELPRIVNGTLEHRFNSSIIPKDYVLGTGHVLFFTNKLLFLANRYHQIFNELEYRGFEPNPKFSPTDMLKKIETSEYNAETCHTFSEEEVSLSRKRIIEKIKLRPDWYKWTHRPKPNYVLE